jgi:hypothetical protein
MPNKFAPKNKQHIPGITTTKVNQGVLDETKIGPDGVLIREMSAIEKALYQDTLEAQAAMAAGEAKIPTWGKPFNEGATTYYEDQLVAARLRIEEVTKALKAANEDAEALYKALLSLHSPNNLDIREVMVTMDVVIQNHRRRIGK